MKFSIHKTPNGYYGTITVFTHPSAGVGDIVGADSAIQVGALGDTPADSLLHAGSMLDHITSDPTINALLPPQAKLAIQTIKTAAAAAKKGTAVARKVFGFFHHKKKKKAAAAVQTISRAQQRATPMTRAREPGAASDAQDDVEPTAPNPIVRDHRRYQTDYDDADYGDENEDSADDAQEAADAASSLMEEGAVVDPVDPREQNNVDVDVYDAAQSSDGDGGDGDSE